MSLENQDEVIGFTPRFSVMDMAGESHPYQSGSIKNLRLQLAVKYAALSPCLTLLKQSDGSVIEDTSDLAEAFDGVPEPYKLYLVNTEQGVKKDVAEWSGDTWVDILEHHLEYGDVDAIRKATELGNMNVDVADRLGKTLFHRAAERGDADMIHLLLDAGLNVDAKCGTGDTPLNCAARAGHVDAVRALLGAGADPLLGNKNGLTPIHMASQCGEHSDDVVSLLIETAGVDVNVTDDDGWTPLHWAAWRNARVEVMRTLVRAGADVNTQVCDKGRTPADFAEGLSTWARLLWWRAGGIAQQSGSYRRRCKTTFSDVERLD